MKKLCSFKECLTKGIHVSARALIALFMGMALFIGTIHAQSVPNINWTKQFGTSAADMCQGVSAWENIYLSGATAGTFPGQTFDGVYFDGFVTKYDPAGSYMWANQYGTGGSETGYGVITDATGVYTVGITNGTFPGQTSFGQQDIFIRKYDHNGNELWTRQFGTSGMEMTPEAIAIDATGVYTVGQTTGAVPGFTNAGGTDFFIVKYSLDGDYLWSKQAGTSGTDNCFGLFADNTGLYACGRSTGNLFGHVSTGMADAFIAKYTPNGDTVWTRLFGTALTENAYEITGNETGLYVSGSTNGIFPGQSYAGGSNDAYLVKYDREGNQLWLREYGTAGLEVGTGISANISGVCIGGYTSGAFPGQVPPIGNDIYAVRYNNNGDQLWLLEQGSEQRPASQSAPNDYTYAVSVVSLKAYIAGYTNGVFPGNTSIGGSDGFVMEVLIQTPQEATQDLIVEVEYLVASGVLNQGQGNALIVKLQASIQKMNQGNYIAAKNNLIAFINQVNAFVNAGILTAGQGGKLTISAQKIIDVLNDLLLQRGEVTASGDLPGTVDFQVGNYPNPSGFSTTIQYTLPEDLHVTLKVYDCSGKELSTLVDETQSRGNQSVQVFTGEFPAGIYYYRLQAGTYSTTKKLLVIK